MSKTSVELRQDRADLIAQARALYEERSDNGQLTAEDDQQFNELMKKADQLRDQYEQIERLEAAESDIDQRHNRGGAGDLRPDPNGDGENRGQPQTGRASAEYRSAYDQYLLNGQNGINLNEMRALQADNDTLGGFLVTPQQMVDTLIKNVDNMVYMRQFGTGYRVTSADSLGAPSLDNDPADATWTSEIGTVSEDSTMSFGKRNLTPHPLRKLIKVSQKLLRKVPSSSDLVSDRLAYKFAVTWENAALNGSGSGQPLGVFTASNDGIPTGRDMSTDNTTTEVTADNLINNKYNLKGQYHPRARWIAHRDFFKMVAKLKDGEGQYLWRESVRAGEPDRLLGFPCHMSEYAPNTFTTGLYVAILGDFSQYWYVDALDFSIQRLNELYAATAQVGFIGQMESDGMPVVSEAFSRVKLA